MAEPDASLYRTMSLASCTLPPELSVTATHIVRQLFGLRSGPFGLGFFIYMSSMCMHLFTAFVNVHFQQHEYDHDGGQNVQSDAMFNIDPDNHFHASISTDTNYYSDEQFVRDVKSKGDLSFIHFNARSLNTNFQKIKDSINDLKLSFDIIAISETWAETDTIDGFTLNGYEAFHIVRGQRKGGGVALYCSSKIQLCNTSSTM